jgi:hypothetical protein
MVWLLLAGASALLLEEFNKELIDLRCFNLNSGDKERLVIILLITAYTLFAAAGVGLWVS